MTDRKQVSVLLFFWSYLAASLLGLWLMTSNWPASRYRNPTHFFIGQILGIYAGVIFYCFIYRIWKAFPSGTARTTPGKAVGFLFIPVFHFYWWFQVVAGWCKDINAFAKRSTNVIGIPDSLGILAAVANAVGPVAGIFLGIFNRQENATDLYYLVSMTNALFIFRAIQTLNGSTSHTRVRLRQEPLIRSVVFGFVLTLVLFAFTHRYSFTSEYVDDIAVKLIARALSHWWFVVFLNGTLAAFSLAMVIRLMRTVVSLRVVKIVVLLCMFGLGAAAVATRTYSSRNNGLILIADSARTPADWLTDKAHSTHDARLLRRIIRNPNCPNDVLQELSHNPSESVRRTALQRLGQGSEPAMQSDEASEVTARKLAEPQR